jgi:hypothetical protein
VKSRTYKETFQPILHARIASACGLCAKFSVAISMIELGQTKRSQVPAGVLNTCNAKPAVKMSGITIPVITAARAV